MRNYRFIIGGAGAFSFFLLLRYTYDSLFVSLDENAEFLLGGNKFLGIFHYLGETKFIIFVTLIFLLLLWWKFQHYEGMLFVIFTVPIGHLLNQIVKRWVERPRPEIENQLASFSFPSGHAMMGLLYLFAIAFLLSERTENKKLHVGFWAGAILLALFIGLSRVAESRHFATDVIAGWSLGFAWFSLCAYWYKRKEKKRVIANRK